MGQEILPNSFSAAEVGNSILAEIRVIMSLMTGIRTKTLLCFESSDSYSKQLIFLFNDVSSEIASFQESAIPKRIIENTT